MRLNEAMHQTGAAVQGEKRSTCGLTALCLKTPILNRFGDMRALYGLRVRQIGDGTRDFENAMVGARGQIEMVDGLLEQAFARCIRRTMLVDFFGT